MKRNARFTKKILTRVVMGLLLLAMLGGVLTSCARGGSKITTISKNIATIEGDFMVYFPALIVYLIITAVFTYIFNWLEKRFSAYL